MIYYLAVLKIQPKLSGNSFNTVHPYSYCPFVASLHRHTLRKDSLL